MTLIDAVVVRQFPVPMLTCGGSTKVLHHVVPSWAHFFRMIDACCGLGGVAHGALAAGLERLLRQMPMPAQFWMT